jgi:hypothetical protein
MTMAETAAVAMVMTEKVVADSNDGEGSGNDNGNDSRRDGILEGTMVHK